MAGFQVANVAEALIETQNSFNDFWENPIREEADIFYKFLLMQSFIQLQFPPSLLSDFWTKDNTALVSIMGEDIFYKYGKKRDARFKEYHQPCDILANTPCFKSGSTPHLEEEFSAIANFSGTVFHNVEEYYYSDSGSGRLYRTDYYGKILIVERNGSKDKDGKSYDSLDSISIREGYKYSIRQK